MQGISQMEIQVWGLIATYHCGSDLFVETRQDVVVSPLVAETMGLC